MEYRKAKSPAKLMKAIAVATEELNLCTLLVKGLTSLPPPCSTSSKSGVKQHQSLSLTFSAEHCVAEQLSVDVCRLRVQQILWMDDQLQFGICIRARLPRTPIGRDECTLHGHRNYSPYDNFPLSIASGTISIWHCVQDEDGQIVVGGQQYLKNLQ